MSPLSSLTNFGDSASVAPAALVIALVLALGGSWRAAGVWCVTFLSGIALVAASKIAFLGWGLGIPAMNFTGISGHSTMAAIVFLAVAHIATVRAPAFIRVGAIMAAGSLAVAVGVSRIALQFHSVSEVVAGCALGAGLVLAFAHVTRTDRPSTLSPLITVGIFAAVITAAHGVEAPSHSLVTRVALKMSGHTTPYSRGAQPALLGAVDKAAPRALDTSIAAIFISANR